MIWAARRRATAAIASAPASSAAPDASRSRTIAGVDRPAGELVGDRRRGEDRREVADGVAPAVVHLDGLDDHLGDRSATATPAGEPALPVIEGGPRPGRGGRLERPDRGRRPALVRDPDDEAAGRRVERELERLGGDDRRRTARQAAAAERPRAGSRRPPGRRARSSRSR